MTSKKANHRVVVTGLGPVTSIGIGWPEFWKNLLAGQCGISRVESFDTSAYDRHYGGEIKDFRPEQFLDRRLLPFMGRTSQLASVAAKLALEDARLTPKDLDPARTGVFMGTTMGESQVIEEFSFFKWQKKNAQPDRFLFLQYPTSMLALHVSQVLHLKSNSVRVFSAACSGGNYAMAYGFDQIREGRLDRAFVGGSDAFSRVAFTGFHRVNVMAKQYCRPFSKTRDGMLVGEGAGVLVIEREDLARARGAPIYAEVKGYGLSCAVSHGVTPDTHGIEDSITRALQHAGWKPSDVDYICAHGTGTLENDSLEAQAIERLFYKQKKVPVSSIKGSLGHTMGAASALELVACCLALRDQTIPSTINWEGPDATCPVDCVPNNAMSLLMKRAFNFSQAFGGNVACIALNKESGY